MRNSRLYLTVTAALILGGCGATTPVVQKPVLPATSEQVASSEDFSSLYQLYQQALTAVEGKDRTQFPDVFKTLSEMSEKLVSLKREEITSQLDASKLDSGQIPLNKLSEVNKEIASYTLPGLNWQSIQQLISTAKEATTTAITQKQTDLEKQEVSTADKLVALDDLYNLTNDNSWQDKRNSIIDGIVEEIRAAKEAGNLTPDIREKIEIVRQNRADDKVLADELITMSAEIFQQDYFKSLSDGDADKAYQTFLAMKESNDFEQIKTKLTDSSQNMVDYFVALADDSVKQPENLAQSYRWYSQARVVTETLGLTSKAKEGEAALTEQLMAKFNELKESGDNTRAFAYLYYVKEFTPGFRGLRQMLIEQEERVASEAIKRISTTKFAGTEQQGYSDVVSSNLTQYMFTHIPNDVRIVEREQYEAIMLEQSLDGNNSALAAVDLLITGSILDAKVDNTETRGKKIMRIKAGTEETSNPAYIAWLEMPAKERKKITQPEARIMVDKLENISVNITKHRKIGIFSVSYRLVDAANGRVLFPDSLSEEIEYSDESREGVEMGDFNLEFKLADLPSDVKILDELAKKVSEQIGERIVARLKDQELQYLAEADEFANDKSCDQESDRLAKALVIMKAKKQDQTDVFKRFKDVTINCAL